jgi:hypothetical protein
MVESNLFEADEQHALIIGYSLGKTRLPSVLKSADIVEAFARRYNFTSITVLKDNYATPKAITEFFTQQELKCKAHSKNNSNKKYLLMVYYSGHGKLLHGTQRLCLKEDKGYPLEAELRNFKKEHSKNAFVWGIFDSCRITEAKSAK